MKLVRDYIPQIIRENGRECDFHIADLPEMKNRICDKFLEELEEFKEEPSLEEAADIYEVFRTMLWAWNLDYERVLDEAHKKRSKRGSFLEGIVLEKVHER
jgi:predicted house-cleaning noncanonical NTP pyrophosphatase (MazG superfamily)